MRCLPLLALTFSFLIGCSSSDAPADDRGELDRVQFGFEDFGCFGGGCSPRQTIAQGAHVVLLAKGDDAEGRYRGRVSAPGLAVEQEGLRCTCREDGAHGSMSEWSTPADEACYAPAVRHCARAFTLHAIAIGPATLEVLAPSGEVVDRIGLAVAKPQRLEAVVKAVRPHGGTVRTIAPSADGSFEVEAPMRIEVETKAFDAEGHELRKRADDVRLASTEVPLSSDAGALVQSPTVLHLTATGLGMTIPIVVRVVERRAE